MKLVGGFVGFVVVVLMLLLTIDIVARMDGAQTRQGDMNRAWEAQHYE